MKPEWSKAPAWANWLAEDKDGSWWWYEFKPVLVAGVHVTGAYGTRFKRAKAPPRSRKLSLEKRP